MLQKFVKFFLLIALIVGLNSCSLGFLVSKSQPITIVKDSLATIKINKKDPEIKDNKILLLRNGEPQQAIVTRDGYKTQYGVCIPYKLSNEGIGTIAIYAAIVGVPLTIFAGTSGASFITPFFTVVGGSLGGMIGYVPIMLDPKFWEFDKTIYMNEPMIPVPVKDSISKEIKINKMAVDICTECSEDYVLEYKDYKKGKLKTKVNVKAENGLKLNDTYFTDELNLTLKKNGFIDTTGLVLRSGYNQNAYIEGTIIGYKWYFVPNSNKST